ncbi:MAG: hypothetical protein P1U36_00210 [Legionellaceae bacterium]|nr:hypothetical protein [Legionellaceae bacterium]
MLKPYTKNIYKSIFGDARCHDYGYGFARGFEEKTPNLKLGITLAMSVTVGLVGLVIGGPVVGLVAGLITAMAVHFLYADVIALAAGQHGKEQADQLRNKRPLLSGVASILAFDKAVETLGAELGEEAGEAMSNELSECFNFS